MSRWGQYAKPFTTENLTVTNGSGAVAGTNVDDVEVTCASALIFHDSFKLVFDAMP